MATNTSFSFREQIHVDFDTNTTTDFCYFKQYDSGEILRKRIFFYRNANFFQQTRYKYIHRRIGFFNNFCF